MPAVADVTATACAAPTLLANASSNFAPTGPVVIHPERRTDATRSMSSRVIDGRENGRNGGAVSRPPVSSMSLLTPAVPSAAFDR